MTTKANLLAQPQKKLEDLIEFLRRPVEQKTHQQLAKFIEYTRRVPLFKQLIDSRCHQVHREFCQSLQHEYVRKSKVLYKLGQKSDKFYLLLSGTVGLYMPGEVMQGTNSIDSKKDHPTAVGNSQLHPFLRRQSVLDDEDKLFGLMLAQDNIFSNLQEDQQSIESPSPLHQRRKNTRSNSIISLQQEMNFLSVQQATKGSLMDKPLKLGKTIHALQCFGDTALQEEAVLREDAAVCLQDCHIACISRTDFSRIMRSQEQKKMLRRFEVMTSTPLFAYLIEQQDFNFLKSLCEQCQLLSYRKDDLIFNEGDAIENIYFVRAGDFDIYKKICVKEDGKKKDQNLLLNHSKSEKVFRLFTIARGEMFGEEDMLEILQQQNIQQQLQSAEEEIHRSYGVRCVSTEGQLITLPKGRFLDIFRHAQLIKKQVEGEPDKKLQTSFIPAQEQMIEKIRKKMAAMQTRVIEIIKQFQRYKNYLVQDNTAKGNSSGKLQKAEFYYSNPLYHKESEKLKHRKPKYTVHGFSPRYGRRLNHNDQESGEFFPIKITPMQQALYSKQRIAVKDYLRESPRQSSPLQKMLSIVRSGKDFQSALSSASATPERNSECYFKQYSPEQLNKTPMKAFQNDCTSDNSKSISDTDTNIQFLGARFSDAPSISDQKVADNSTVLQSYGQQSLNQRHANSGEHLKIIEQYQQTTNSKINQYQNIKVNKNQTPTQRQIQSSSSNFIHIESHEQQQAIEQQFGDNQRSMSAGKQWQHIKFYGRDLLNNAEEADLSLQKNNNNRKFVNRSFDISSHTPKPHQRPFTDQKHIILQQSTNSVKMNKGSNRYEGLQTTLTAGQPTMTGVQLDSYESNLHQNYEYILYTQSKTPQSKVAKSKNPFFTRHFVQEQLGVSLNLKREAQNQYQNEGLHVISCKNLGEAEEKHHNLQQSKTMANRKNQIVLLDAYMPELDIPEAQQATRQVRLPEKDSFDPYSLNLTLARLYDLKNIAANSPIQNSYIHQQQLEEGVQMEEQNKGLQMQQSTRRSYRSSERNNSRKQQMRQVIIKALPSSSPHSARNRFFQENQPKKADYLGAIAPLPVRSCSVSIPNRVEMQNFCLDRQEQYN